MTLIEAIVALALVSIALLSLLGALMVTARAQHQDKARAFALRLATDRVERARAMRYDALTSATENGVSPGNGYRYTIDRAVAEVDAATLGAPAVNGGRVKQVTVTVRWTALSGAASSVSVQTSVAARTRAPTVGGSGTSLPSPTASREIVSFNAVPSPVTTYADGAPTSAITLQAELTGHSTSDVATASWADDSGDHTATLTSSGAGTWKATIPTSGFRRVVAAGDATASTLFTLTTHPSGQTATASLAVGRYAPPAYSFVGLSTSADPIRLKGGRGPEAGTNDSEVTVSATMTGLDPGLPATGVLGYLTLSGYQTVNLPRRTDSPQQFSYTFARGSESFAPGSQAFTVSISQGDTTASRQITVTVS